MATRASAQPIRARATRRPVTVALAGAEQRVAGLDQGRLHRGALVGGQAGRQAPAAVVVMGEADGAHLLGRGAAGILGRLAVVTTGEHVARQRAAQLADRGPLGEGGHLGVGRRRRMAAYHRDLVLTEPSRLQGSPSCRQPAQAVGHGHQRAGTSRRQSALPGHPVPRRADAALLPRPGGHRLGDQGHQPPGGGVENPAHLGHLGLQNSHFCVAQHRLGHAVMVPNLCSIWQARRVLSLRASVCSGAGLNQATTSKGCCCQRGMESDPEPSRPHWPPI